MRQKPIAVALVILLLSSACTNENQYLYAGEELPDEEVASLNLVYETESTFGVQHLIVGLIVVLLFMSEPGHDQVTLCHADLRKLDGAPPEWRFGDINQNPSYKIIPGQHLLQIDFKLRPIRSLALCDGKRINNILPGFDPKGPEQYYCARMDLIFEAGHTYKLTIKRPGLVLMDLTMTPHKNVASSALERSPYQIVDRSIWVGPIIGQEREPEPKLVCDYSDVKLGPRDW